MSIVTTNPAFITVQLKDTQNLTREQMFKLAHYIDAYEIERNLQETLVIDINRISRSGIIELLLTPKEGLAYEELSYHLEMAITYSLNSVNLGECKWEVVNISFEPERPGKPSYVVGEDVHSTFKTY
jgi:hypothetical protein